MNDHPSLRTQPCPDIQTPFLEALRPLEWQIKLSVVLRKIPPGSKTSNSDWQQLHPPS